MRELEQTVGVGDTTDHPIREFVVAEGVQSRNSGVSTPVLQTSFENLEGVVFVISAPTVRLIITSGWAASLFLLLAVRPNAQACPILNEHSATALAYNFAADPKNIGCVTDQNEDLRSGIANKSTYPDDQLDTFDIGAADFYLDINPVVAESLTETLTYTTHALNRYNGSGHQSFRFRATTEDYTSEHDVAVAAYYAMYEINGDLASDVLNSYRTINRVAGDIAAAMELPLDAIGLGRDSTGTQGNVSSIGFTATNNRQAIGEPHHIDIDFISGWIRFLLSLDALPYYIFASSVVTIFVAFSMARSRRS